MPSLPLPDLAQGLAHPVRIAILQLMADGKRRLSGDITSSLQPLPRTTVSQHLRVLRDLGLLEAEPQGMLMWYTLDKGQMQAMQKAFTAFFDRF